MSTATLERTKEKEVVETDWEGIVRDLGPEFARRAAATDKEGGFVEDNYRDLREHGLFWMCIPTELGGGGATYQQVCSTIREIGRHCGSTALAFAMHTHPLATNVNKYVRGDDGAARTLRKIAENRLVIAGTGANDWLDSSGQATRVEGGYAVTAHKRFVSGAPGAQLFVTSANHDGGAGREVLHFAVPFGAEGVRIVDTWDALGMRGTGSHDVTLHDVFVPDAAIVTRRPAGIWHPMWDVVLPSAMPLITSAYVGLAEGAVELARAAAMTKGALLAPVLGETMNALTVARMALADMVGLNEEYTFVPSLERSSLVLARKAIATEAVKRAVELSSELVGGPGFMKGHALERIVRDVRAMHFHPLPLRRQLDFTGRVALGLDPVNRPDRAS